jgi:hypothetical protein
MPRDKENSVKRLKITAALAMTACAILAATASSAAAALPELLPGTKGTKFTGKSGKGTLQIKSGAAVSCMSTTGEGELTSPTAGKGTITFKGCSTAGLSINSLGNAAGTVTISGETSVCYVNSKAKEVGVVTRIPEAGVHLEVPSVKLLLLKKGDFIILATPLNKSTTTFTGVLEQKEGKQAITKCEGGPEEIVLVSTDGGAFVQAGLEVKEDVLTFEKSEELMA